MRTYEIVISFFLFSYGNFCNAQFQTEVDTVSFWKNHRLILSVSAGMAAPSGEFSFFETHKQVQDPNYYLKPANLAGPARFGWNGRLSLSYLFLKHFGFICMFKTTINEASTPTITELFSFPDIVPLGRGAIVTSYDYSSKKWYTNNLLLGPVFFFEYNIFSLTFKLTGGIQQVLCPETILNEKGYWWDANGYAFPYTMVTDQPRLYSYNFVFDGGADFKVLITKRFGIILSLDYLASAASFKGQSNYIQDVSWDINPIHNEGTELVKFNKNISLILFNAGVSYRLK